ncbi:hypothetical protein DVH05_014140 [Phytophthora capsici]|nr:hypothetical protein DVH05_014140 [Phytophthora capsici]
MDTQARTERSPFDTDIRRECVVRGITRRVPLDVFRKFQAVASTHRLSFQTNRIFRKPTGDRLTLPFEDIRFLPAGVRLPHMGIEGTLRVFRDQTSRDDRPNKALRPRLYRQHLASEELELLCSIAEQGVVPHWHHPDASWSAAGPTQLSQCNYGATVVTHRLLKNYYAGRCIIATMAALTAEPGFHLCFSFKKKRRSLIRRWENHPRLIRAPRAFGQRHYGNEPDTRRPLGSILLYYHAHCGTPHSVSRMPRIRARCRYRGRFPSRAGPLSSFVRVWGDLPTFTFRHCFGDGGIRVDCVAGVLSHHGKGHKGLPAHRRITTSSSLRSISETDFYKQSVDYVTQ